MPWKWNQEKSEPIAMPAPLECLAVLVLLFYWMSSASAAVIPATAKSLLEDKLAGSSLSFSGMQFAGEENPITSMRLDFRLRESIFSADSESGDLPSELRVRTFLETGIGAQRSFDADPVVLRWSLTSPGHFWLGRSHPVAEMHSDGDHVVSRHSAVGANWVQLQSDALSPRVSGWIGMGLTQKMRSANLTATFAFSPLFLPTFGPKLDYSEVEDASGTRFARLPPAYIDLDGNGTLFPMRYRIETGDLKEIVIQNQIFLGLLHEMQSHRFGLMVWSAPNPEPTTDTTGFLRVASNNVNVLVTAKPTFERQNFVGAILQLDDLPLKPELQSAYELRTHQLTLSSTFRPSSQIKFGFLHRFDSLVSSGISSGAEGEETGGVQAPSAPNYGEMLFWMQGEYPFTDQIKAKLLFERNFSTANAGQYLSPSVEYRSGPRLSFFGRADLLTGKDFSYFGTWRALDSVSVGTRLVW